MLYVPAAELYIALSVLRAIRALIEVIRESGAKHYFDVGAIIGKCENFLVITFILADAFTGSALIFTAKSIVRREDIEKDPGYYLGGTLVNFSYSVLIGYLIRIALNSID